MAETCAGYPARGWGGQVEHIIRCKNPGKYECHGLAYCGQHIKAAQRARAQEARDALRVAREGLNADAWAYIEERSLVYNDPEARALMARKKELGR